MSNLSKVLAGFLFSTSMLFASPHSLDTKHSQVGFSVKHLMITNVKGDFKEFSGEIDFDHENKTFNKFKGVIKTASIDTGIEKRDNHLRSEDFFLASKYPEITYEMTSYKDGVMNGNLTMRGVTKEVPLKVEDLATVVDFKGNKRVGFTLSGEVNRIDYGLKWNKALEFGGVAVSETVKIIVDIQAIEK